MITEKLDPVPLLLRAARRAPGRLPHRLPPRRGVLRARPGAGGRVPPAAQALRPDNFAANINLGVVADEVRRPGGGAGRLPGRRPDRPGQPAGHVQPRPRPGRDRRPARRRRPARPGRPPLPRVRRRPTWNSPASWRRPATCRRPSRLPGRRRRRSPRPRRASDRLAALLARSGNPHRHLDGLRALAAGAPDNADYQTQLGGALVDAGRVDEGMAALRRAIELAPGGSVAYQFMGVAHASKGDEAGAARWLRKAVELDPANRLDAAPGWAGAGEPRPPGRGRRRPRHRPADRPHPRHRAPVPRRRREPPARLPRRRRRLPPRGRPRTRDPAHPLQPRLRPAQRRRPGRGRRPAPGGDPPRPRRAVPVDGPRHRPRFAGRPADAAEAFRTALRVRPGFPPAAAGLAEAERLLAP